MEGLGQVALDLKVVHLDSHCLTNAAVAWTSWARRLGQHLHIHIFLSPKCAWYMHLAVQVHVECSHQGTVYVVHASCIMPGCSTFKTNVLRQGTRQLASTTLMKGVPRWVHSELNVLRPARMPLASTHNVDGCLQLGTYKWMHCERVRMLDRSAMKLKRPAK